MSAPEHRPASSLRTDRIVAATRRLFVRHGYRRTSMEDIATEAGVAKATLYLHFNGKEAIFKTMLEACRADMQARVAAAEVGDFTLEARLTALLYAHYGTVHEWFEDTVHLRELFLIIIEDPETFGPVADEHQFAARVDAVLAAAISADTCAPQSDQTIHLITTVLRDVAIGAKSDSDVSLDAYRARLAGAAKLAVAALGMGSL